MLGSGRLHMSSQRINFDNTDAVHTHAPTASYRKLQETYRSLQQLPSLLYRHAFGFCCFALFLSGCPMQAVHCSAWLVCQRGS